MKNYLLGTLAPDQQTALQDRIAWNPRVYEELLEVEKQLIDEYLAGSLSKMEKHQFETHFLTTAERQKDLRFGQLVKERLNSDAIPARKHFTSEVKHTAPALKFPLFSSRLARRRKNFMKRLD